MNFEFSTRWNQAEFMILIWLEATSIQRWFVQNDKRQIRDFLVVIYETS